MTNETTCIQHMALNCRDRHAQEAFYSSHFGFRRARVFREGTPDEFVMLRLGPSCLELFSVKDPEAWPRAGEQPVGFKHFALEVTDIEEKVNDLHARGVETDPIIDCSAMVEGMKVCFFDDPEGNRVELIQGFRDQIG